MDMLAAAECSLARPIAISSASPCRLGLLPLSNLTDVHLSATHGKGLEVEVLKQAECGSDGDA